MRLPLRIRKEADNMKYCIATYNTAIGIVHAHTFLTDEEIEKARQHDFDIQVISK